MDTVIHASKYAPVSQVGQPVSRPQAYHKTAAKAALVFGFFFTVLCVGGVVSLLGVCSFGMIPFAALVTMTVVGGVGSMLCFLKAYWASRKKENLSFEQYVEKKCCEFTLVQATGLASLGKEIVQAISCDQMLTDQQLFTVEGKAFCKRALTLLQKNSEILLRKEELEAAIEQGNLTDEQLNLLKRVLLIPVSWHFIKCMFDTEQGYEKGMIKFNDPQHRIVTFFEPAMVKRASTHFRAERNSSLGCDILRGLPYVFRHALMGSLKHTGLGWWSFCKLEEYGVESCRERIKHGFGMVRMVVTQMLGEADGPNDRKEKRIPKEIKKAFELLCSTIGLRPDIKLKTVAAMVEWAEAQQQNHAEAVQAFMQALDRHYPKATHIYHQYRTGSEAIIDPL